MTPGRGAGVESCCTAIAPETCGNSCWYMLWMLVGVRPMLVRGGGVMNGAMMIGCWCTAEFPGVANCHSIIAGGETCTYIHVST